MNEDRIMSEYEVALFQAVRIIGLEAIKAGANETSILTQLKEGQNDAESSNRKNEAATLAQLIRTWCEPERHFQPGDSN